VWRRRNSDLSDSWPHFGELLNSNKSSVDVDSTSARLVVVFPAPLLGSIVAILSWLIAIAIAGIARCMESQAAGGPKAGYSCLAVRELAETPRSRIEHCGCH